MLVVLVFSGVLCLLVLAGMQARHHAPRARLAEAMDFPLPGVAEALAEKEGISMAEAKRIETEFRRWFAVAAASPVRIGMGSKQVDAFWHLLLERPDLYERFSMAVSGRLLAHIEGIGGEILEARSWVAYESVWGASPPADLWPRPSEGAMRRVRASVRRSDTRGTGGDGGNDPTIFIAFSGSGGDDGSHHHHHHGGGDGGGHGHGADGGSHGSCGGHGCGGGH